MAVQTIIWVVTKMDNNNFNNGMPSPQNMQNNMPNMQPNMGAPVNGQFGPMGQPMQPGTGPNMQPNMGQMGPYPQPMMKQPKQPMDPAKKKKIVLIVVIISILAVVGIALAIILPIVLRVDYSSAYNTAKDLKSDIYDIYQSYDCEYVIDYVDSSYTTIKRYDDYIEGCKEIYNQDVDNLVNQLENTDGVRRNAEIKTQFEKFKNEYTSLSAGDAEELSYKLSLWKARHDFVIALDGLSYESSDADFTKAASYLIDSGNDTLKTYGEGWLEWKKNLAEAYRAYNNAPWSNYNNYKALREVFDNKKKEYEDWLATNKPNINDVAPLNFNDASKMYSEFNKLYDLIRETYQKNYNSGSSDCTEFLGEVYCE